VLLSSLTETNENRMVHQHTVHCRGVLRTGPDGLDALRVQSAARRELRSVLADSVVSLFCLDRLHRPPGLSKYVAAEMCAFGLV